MVCCAVLGTLYVFASWGIYALVGAGRQPDDPTLRYRSRAMNTGVPT
jgi:hypothetical protein